jgi:RNA-splicing ligase RtcB
MHIVKRDELQFEVEMIEIRGKYTTAKVMIDDLDESCAAQINQFVNHPAFTNPVAIMPDTHAGKGSVIGFTMPISSMVIPNVIGVDIGCGMLSVNIGKNLPGSLEVLDRNIRRKVPFGTVVHEKSIIHMEREFPWDEVNVRAEKFTYAYRERFGIVLLAPKYNMEWFLSKSDMIKSGGARRFINSIGTLGGGNHFIEIGKDLSQSYWITIHTGSRNFGKCICEYWQGKAAKAFSHGSKDEVNRLIEKARSEIQDEKLLYQTIKELKGRKKKPGIHMKGCEWLDGADASGYLFDMVFAQVYAEVNRRYIGRIVCTLCDATPVESIETVHNFIDFRDFIIRKGAIRSYAGERMIIPFNMRDGILICDGRSNPDWNFSAPHGAGRALSRAQAKRSLDLEVFRRQMSGIFSTSVGKGTLDEAPDAYKSSSIIEELIQPTAVIIDRIRPVHNMKDSEGAED